MRTFLFILLIVFTKCTDAQDFFRYSAINIPDSLKKNADAVFRHEEMEVTVLSNSELVTREYSITTVLTEKGRRHSVIRIGADKMTKLDEVEIKVYNSLGLEVGKYKKKDFKVEGAYDGITLASDDKVYELQIPTPDIPFTIEKKTTVNYSGYINIPSWGFGGSNESLILSRYIVKVPDHLKINYKTYNTDLKPVIENEGSLKIYKWEMNNHPVPAKEEGSYGPPVYMPYVDVSPESFTYDSYGGSSANWKEFGKWSYSFYEEEKPLEPERVAFFQQLVQPGATEKEKIAILYKYLQNETRYVSIQFGIGGFKPFPVSFLEKKKYGDCKALTHYMKAMLKAAGIKSYAALINAGTNAYPVDPLFAHNKFNHVILCVPLAKDSVWLECTGKQTAPGILGNFTENRNALLLTENGGIIVNTPTSKAVNNQWIAKSNTEIMEDGGAVVRSRIYVTGEFWESIYYATNSKSKDEIKKALVGQFGYKAPDEYELKIVGDSATGHVITIDLAYYKFFDFKAGSKHFFPFRQYKLNEETITPAENRKYEYLFDFPYVKTDSAVYKLPANFKQESLPAFKEIKNNFVQYQNNIQLNSTANELTVTTHLTLKTHLVPAKLYNEAALAFEAIKKDEGQKIVLKKE
jgi:Domain of Unknown Function with PDB structure (DUF3857)/Transglutaminase-like superfamily